MRLLLLAAPAASMLALPAAAQPNPAEEQAVISAIRGYHAAAGSGNPEGARPHVLGEGIATCVGCGANPRSEVYPSALADEVQLIEFGPEGLENDILDPEVRISGNLATVWARYEYRATAVGGGCGISSYQLVRLDGHWRILSHAWTYPIGCAPQ